MKNNIENVQQKDQEIKKVDKQEMNNQREKMQNIPEIKDEMKAVNVEFSKLDEKMEQEKTLSTNPFLKELNGLAMEVALNK